MKCLFVSLDGLIADIAWHVVQEGHDVKFYINDPGEKEIADGFVPKTDNWERDADWADLVVFDDVLGQGTHAQRLRQSGKLVVGGTPYTDRLEDDRAFGQQELKKAGVTIIPQQNFTSFDDAVEFVKANPGRYVIKPSGEAQNFKRLLFVGEEEDGQDVIQVLGDYKAALSHRIKEFQLQRRIMGVEVAVGLLQRKGVRVSGLRELRAQETLPGRHRPVERARWERRCSGASPTESAPPRFTARSAIRRSASSRRG
jgi:phosphoribosylamine---glycine ligase